MPVVSSDGIEGGCYSRVEGDKTIYYDAHGNDIDVSKMDAKWRKYYGIVIKKPKRQVESKAEDAE